MLCLLASVFVDCLFHALGGIVFVFRCTLVFVIAFFLFDGIVFVLNCIVVVIVCVSVCMCLGVYYCCVYFIMFFCVCRVLFFLFFMC